MKRTAQLAIVLGLAFLTGCGQSSGLAASSTQQPSSSASAAAAATSSASPVTAAPVQSGLPEDLTFTGQLSGHIWTATATGDCGVKSDSSGKTFEATIDFALPDGIHGFRVIWPNYLGSINVPGVFVPGIAITPAGAPDRFAAGDTYRGPSPKVTVSADQHSGTVDGDYYKGPTPPPGGIPGQTPPPSQGHVSGTWRCA